MTTFVAFTVFVSILGSVEHSIRDITKVARFALCLIVIPASD